MLKSSKLTDPLVARLHTVSTLRVATERDFDGLTGAIKLALHDKVAVLDTEQSRGIMEALSANTSWEVTNKQSKVISKSPPLPFITSSLQQDSSRQLGYSPGRTMQLAQGLYERGYITYMRTDSPTLSDNAKVAATKLIVNTYGKEYLASERDKRKSCSSPPKNAQEAHEAIRPAETNGIFRHPDSLKGELAGDEWRLYDLIFRRTVASLMKPSESLSVTLTISAGDIGHIKGMGKAEKGEVDGKEGMGKALFRCSGTAVHTPGYLKVWDREGSRNYRDNELTRLEIGDKLTLARSEEVWKQAAIAAEEEDLGEENEAATAAEDAADDSALKLEFPGLRSVGRATKAPGRYTESSFIHALETIGVGRPSTYSYILSILREREYIIVDKQSLIPTVKGLLVSRFLTEHFQHFISEEFTAQMESNLDAIAKGDVEKTAFLSQFYFGMDVPPPSASDLMKKKGGDSKGLLQTASQLIDLHKMWKDETSQIDRREYKSLAIPQLADLGKVRITRNGLLFAANYSVVPEGDNELERMWKLPIDIELDIRELTREKVLDILKTAPNVQGNLLGMLPETKENVYLKYGRYGKYLELIPEGADTSSRKVVSRTFKLPYAWYNMTALDFHVPMEDIEALVQLPKTLGISDLQGHGMYEAALDMKNNDLVILFKQLDGDESKRQVFMLPFPRPSFLPGNTEDAVLSKFSVEDAAQLLKAHLDNPLGTEVLPAQGKLVSLTDCRELGMWAYDSDKNTDPAAISIRYGRFGYYLHATKANIVAGLGKRPVESVTLEMAIELLEKKKARMSKAKLAAVKTIKKRAPKAKASASQTEKKSTRAASLKTPAKRKVAKKVPEEASGQVEAQPKALRRTKVVSSDAASPVKNKATTKLKKEALVAKKKTNKGARVGGKKKVSGAAKASLVEDDKDTSSIEVKKPRASREKRSKLL
ncbi:hypothetical protein EON65_07810 [archaeon]|nr:MAG: hypothetical protein EON65_07810 [archaeon]